MAKPTCTRTYSPVCVSGKYSRQASRTMPPNCTLAMRSPPWSYVSTTFPGNARHIESPLPVSSHKLVGDNSLPKRDSTVVRGNQGVQEYAKAATAQLDRKSTRLNSSHRCISYAV